jgi:FkbM family methyltransferase
VDWRDTSSILDMGANVGMATIWFALKAPSARIIAVEPDPTARGSLKANVAANSLGDRVDVVGVAVGAAAGTAHLQSDGGSVFSMLGSEGDGPEVKVVSLSELLESCNLDHVDVLKIDCEGMEYDVFAHADADVLDRIGTVVGEYHAFGGHKGSELKALLAPGGFHLWLSAPDHNGCGLFRATRSRAA